MYAKTFEDDIAPLSSNENFIFFFIFSLKRVKDKVWNARLRSPLFNTRQYTHNLEGLLLKVWRRYENGLEPDHVTP